MKTILILICAIFSLTEFTFSQTPPPASGAETACVQPVAAVGSAASAPSSGDAVVQKIPSTSTVQALFGEAQGLKAPQAGKLSEEVQLSTEVARYLGDDVKLQRPAAAQFLQQILTPDLLDKAARQDPGATRQMQGKVQELARGAIGGLPDFNSSVLAGVTQKDVVGLARTSRKSASEWLRLTRNRIPSSGANDADPLKELDLLQVVEQFCEIADEMAPFEGGEFAKDSLLRSAAYKFGGRFVGVKPTRKQFLNFAGEFGERVDKLHRAIQARYDANEITRGLLIKDAETLVGNTDVLRKRVVVLQALVEEAVAFRDSLAANDARRSFIDKELLFQLVALRSAIIKIMVQNLVAANKHGILIGQFSHVGVVGRAAAAASSIGIKSELGLAYGAGSLDATMLGTVKLEQLNAQVSAGTTKKLREIQGRMEAFDESVQVNLGVPRQTLAAVRDLREQARQAEARFVEKANLQLPEVIGLIADSQKQAQEILAGVGINTKVIGLTVGEQKQIP